MKCEDCKHYSNDRCGVYNCDQPKYRVPYCNNAQWREQPMKEHGTCYATLYRAVTRLQSELNDE